MQNSTLMSNPTDAEYDRSSRIEFENITVEFGATKALQNISVSAQPGEIIGLLGHNGAGKSTLFNVAAGVVPPTQGRFLIDGEPVSLNISPADVDKLGITILHQEPALAANLSVIDNLFLGRSVRRSVRESLAVDALKRVGANVELSQPVASLGLGERQLVSLARGLVGGEMKILLLDEPTAALGRAETDFLHSLIRSFALQGVTIMYVSHRLPDILEVCERILVLRAGELVVDDKASQFTPRALAAALVPDIDLVAQSVIAVPGDVSVSIQTPYEFEFCEGEVVGLFGMAAGEQFALLESMFGIGEPVSFNLDGKRVSPTSPAQAVELGIYLVPADREKDGLISGMSATDNVFLPWYATDRTKGSWVSPKYGASEYADARQQLNVLGPSGDAAIDQFSGGNRQKHLLARWMFPRRPKVLLLAQPTQGVDVGAKLDIARVVREATRTGTVVIVASAESDEISSMCDRAYVMLGNRSTHLEMSADFDERLLEALLSLANTKKTSEIEG